MILVDANLLLYAEDSLSEHHQAARTGGMHSSVVLNPYVCAAGLPHSFASAQVVIGASSLSEKRQRGKAGSISRRAHDSPDSSTAIFTNFLKSNRPSVHRSQAYAVEQIVSRNRTHPVLRRI